jgi:hypothetical protein
MAWRSFAANAGRHGTYPTGDHLAAKGIAVSRKKYKAGQVRPMFCDLWVQDRHALIEAKSSDGREALRMAIGQLYGYCRFHEPPVRLAVPLPHQPNRDGLTLLQSAGIEAIWLHGARFRDSANSAFVEQATDQPCPEQARHNATHRSGRVSGMIKRSEPTCGPRPRLNQRRNRSADLNVPAVDEARVYAGQRPYCRQCLDQN